MANEKNESQHRELSDREIDEFLETAEPSKPSPTDELLRRIDDYRSGYSCGYSDGKNGARMRDKDAAPAFFQIEGVPDVFAEPSPSEQMAEALRVTASMYDKLGWSHSAKSVRQLAARYEKAAQAKKGE